MLETKTYACGAPFIARERSWTCWCNQAETNEQPLKLRRKLLKSQGSSPDAVMTDKLPSYGAALSELGMRASHITGGRISSRAENSHHPIRQRERRMQRLKSASAAQRFLSIHAAVYKTFNVQRHLISRRTMPQFRAAAMDRWDAVTATA